MMIHLASKSSSISPSRKNPRRSARLRWIENVFRNRFTVRGFVDTVSETVSKYRRMGCWPTFASSSSSLMNP